MKFTPPAEVNGKKMAASLSEFFPEGIRDFELWWWFFLLGIYAHLLLSKMLLTSYGRLRSYPESIPLLIDGNISLELPVEYQWKTPRCDTCKVLGHSVKNSIVKRNTSWTPQKNKVKIMQPNINDVAIGAEGDIGAKASNAVDQVVINDSSGDIGSKVMGADRKAASIVDFTIISGSRVEGDKNGTMTKTVASGNSGANIDAISSVTTLISCNSGDGAEKGDSSTQGEWIVAGKKTKKGTTVGGHTSVVSGGNNALNKNGAVTESITAKKSSDQSTCKSTSPVKSGSKSPTNGSGNEVIATTATSVKVQKSPKRNPFMVYSDFKEDIRFSINRTKEVESRKASTPSRVVVNRD